MRFLIFLTVYPNKKHTLFAQNYFMKKVFNLFDLTQKVNYKTEILAGLTVAMTMIPESLSFAILAGLPPLMGLYEDHSYHRDGLPF